MGRGLGKFKQRARNGILVQVFKRYIDADGGTWSTKIAWNALTGLIPIFLIAMTVIGVIVRNKNAEVQFVNHLSGLISDRAQRVQLVRFLRDQTASLALLTFAGLLWRGASLFSAMDNGFAHVYRIKSRDFLPQKMMAMGMMMLFTVLLLPLLATSGLLGLLTRLDLGPAGIATPLIVALQFLIGALDAAIMLTVIYKVVPNVKLRFSQVIRGGIFAGVLLEASTLLFPAYISHQHSATFNNVFVLIIVLLGYFYLVGITCMLGACMNVVHAERVAKSRLSTVA